MRGHICDEVEPCEYIKATELGLIRIRFYEYVFKKYMCKSKIEEMIGQRYALVGINCEEDRKVSYGRAFGNFNGAIYTCNGANQSNYAGAVW